GTVHCNIATYVCTPEGEALDILPGIYSPTAYLEQLQQFRLLTNFVDQEGAEKRAERCKQYHEKLIAALKDENIPPRFINAADRRTREHEGGIQDVRQDGKPTPAPAPPATDP